MASRKNNKNANKSVWFHLEPPVQRGIAGVILLAVALVITLSYFGVSGPLSRLIVKSSGYLFGNGSFLLPLTLFLTALFVLVSEKKKILGSTILGSALFILSLLGVFELVGGAGHAGGKIGFLFDWPFERLFGFWGALIFFTAFFVSAILITFRIPLKDEVREKITFRPNAQGEITAEKKLVLEKGLVSKVASAVGKVKSAPAKIKPAPANETITINTPPGASVADQKQLKRAEADFSSAFSILPVAGGYKFPPLDLLESEEGAPVAGDIKANAVIIQKTLENFGIPVEMSEVNIGPAVTQFTLKPAAGVKLAQITVLQRDISLALAAHPIRIEAPIPGKSLVGIEVPNQKAMLVRLKSMFASFDSASHKAFLNLALGKDVSGRPVWTTLAKMPHLLIAGATGSGKSIAINSILLTFLYQHSPEILRLILIDPKRVELTLYNGIPHLLTPVVIEPKKVVAALKWAVSEMERRYEMLSAQGVRDIQGYNNLSRIQHTREFMPYIVVVVDELADLMAAYGREIEGAVVRLAQMARAVGLHLILATQRPSVEVITGLIKANITSRLAFQVASQVDSRTILDMAGAEKLLGRGDMLFMSSDAAKPRRLQGTFVSEKEVKRVVKFVRASTFEPAGEVKPAERLLDETLQTVRSEFRLDLEKAASDEDLEDELLPQAKEVIFQAGKASASLLQRRLRVGYARAARLLDILEAQGFIGPGEGAKPREILVDKAGADKSNPLETPTDPMV